MLQPGCGADKADQDSKTHVRQVRFCTAGVGGKYDAIYQDPGSCDDDLRRLTSDSGNQRGRRGVIMLIGLFGDIQVSPVHKRELRLAERRRKAKLAYDRTAAAWKTWTHKLAVEEFLPKHLTFMFEEFSMFYEEQAKLRHLPRTVNGRAFAGLQRRLINEGGIELIQGVTRIRTNGQDGKVYRSLLYHDDNGLRDIRGRELMKKENGVPDARYRTA